MDCQELSSDIIFEILTRISSLKTLATCKLVSKEWQRLIYESRFMPTYCKRTKNVFGYYVQSFNSHNANVSTKFVSFDESSSDVSCAEGLPNDMTIMASCNQGIVLCRSGQYSHSYKYYVCKPTTRQGQIIPKPNPRNETIDIALTILKTSPSLHYKIVRLSHCVISHKLGEEHYLCEIFDSKLWSWEEQSDHVILPCDELINSNNKAVSVTNYVHWLTDDDNVLAFHLGENSFRKFALPEPAKQKDDSLCGSKHLLDYQAKLGFSYLTEQGNIELWVIDDPRNCKWNKKMTINLQVILQMVKFPSVRFYNTRILFVEAYDQVIFYNVRDCSYKVVKLDNGPTDCFQFWSDSDDIRLPSRRKR